MLYSSYRGVTNKVIKNSSDQLLVSVLGRGEGGSVLFRTVFVTRGPHVRESKTLLHSGFHAVDSGFLVFASGTWIPDSKIFPDSGFHKQKFPG